MCFHYDKRFVFVGVLVLMYSSIPNAAAIVGLLADIPPLVIRRQLTLLLFARVLSFRRRDFLKRFGNHRHAFFLFRMLAHCLFNDAGGCFVQESFRVPACIQAAYFCVTLIGLFLQPSDLLVGVEAILCRAQTGREWGG